MSCAAGAEGAEDGAGAWVAEASPEPAGADAAGAEAAGAEAAGAWVAEESAGAALFWVQPVRARVATAAVAARGRMDLMDMVSPFR